jgi:hypothetical protein
MARETYQPNRRTRPEAPAHLPERALLPFLVAVLVLGRTATLQGQSDTPSPLPSTDVPAASAVPYWANRGHWNFGAQFGFALENAIPRNISHISLLIAQPQLGLIVRDFQALRFPVRRFEIVSEGIFGNAFHPGGRLTGYALLFRLDGKNRRRVVPFIDFGGGLQRTTLATRAPELSGRTQFSPQAGLGIQHFFNPQRALVLEYRYMHMSNAGITPPNHGFNASMMTIGFRWLRRPRPAGRQASAHRSHSFFHYLFGAE